jgi:hypothetical protein
VRLKNFSFQLIKDHKSGRPLFLLSGAFTFGSSLSHRSLRA